MKSRLNYVTAGAALLFLVAGTSARAQTANGWGVAGMYRVVGVTELGPQQVKLSLQLHLINQSPGGIKLTNLAFLPARPVPAEQNRASMRMQPVASSLELQSRIPVDVARDVVVSRQEYLALFHARVLHFQAMTQNAVGTTQTRTIMLLGEPFTRMK